jgi:hypothetical protein
MASNSNEHEYFLVDINSEFPLESRQGSRCAVKRTKECYIEIYESGNIFCYKTGTRVFHNPDGAAVETKACKSWRLNGRYHRLDGPAFEYSNGAKEYWVNNKLHRLDGPAVLNTDGAANEWWINGVRQSPEKEKLLNIWYSNKSINQH